MARTKQFWLSLFLLCAAGCGERAATDGQPCIYIEEAAPKTVLACVGAESITCADFLKRLDFESALYKLKKGAQPDYARRAERFRLERSQKVLSTLVNMALLMHSAAENGVSISSNQLDAAAVKLARAYGFKGKLGDFLKTVGVDFDYCGKAALQYDLIQEVRDRLYPETSMVSPKEIDEGLARLESYCVRAVASNRVVWATCSNVYEKVKADGDFVKAGERFSIRGVDEAECWGEFIKQEIEDEKLKSWAFSAPPGSIKIFDLDDGLAIVKLYGRVALNESDTEGTASKGDDADIEWQVKLGRILFEMLDPEPEPRTREHVEKELRKWKKQEAQKVMFSDLMKKYPVVFPNGNDLKLRKEKE